MCETLSVGVCVCECACPARHMPHMHANKAVQQQPQRKLKPNQTEPNQVAFPLRVFIHKIEEHKKWHRGCSPCLLHFPSPLCLFLSHFFAPLLVYTTPPRPPPFCATNNSKGPRVHCTCVLMYLKVKSNESTKKKETEKVKKQSRTRWQRLDQVPALLAEAPTAANYLCDASLLSVRSSLSASRPLSQSLLTSPLAQLSELSLVPEFAPP